MHSVFVFRLAMCLLLKRLAGIDIGSVTPSRDIAAERTSSVSSSVTASAEL